MEEGAIPGVQLAHAGRKAGCPAQRPSAVAFRTMPTPQEMSATQIVAVISAFQRRRACILRVSRPSRDTRPTAISCTSSVAPLQPAHRRLRGQFSAPHPAVGSGGQRRARVLAGKPAAVRAYLGHRLGGGGWDIEQSAELAKPLKPAGVDLIDASSGGVSPTKDPLCAGLSGRVCHPHPTRGKIRTAAVGFSPSRRKPTTSSKTNRPMWY